MLPYLALVILIIGIIPACRRFERRWNRLSDEQAADYVRQIGSTVYHPCGTCRMGEDDGAVVDSQLRVRGIDGLRVVDASVMPAMPSPNIHPATIMVAEKSSDIIAKSLAN
jgi:choline dehydrogenase